MAAPSPVRSRTAQTDVLDDRVRRRVTSLDPLFNPTTAVVIGDRADRDASGDEILSTISKSGFDGKLSAVGLDKAATALHVPYFSTIGSVPWPVDLAILTNPADSILQTLADCVAAGTKAAIVAQGFGGDESCRRELYSGIGAIVGRSRIRVLGPNCSVLQNPAIGLNVTYGAALPVGGSIALISQSGALCNAILQWSFREIVGFSALVSIGGMVDVDWGDLIDYFGADPNTHSIIIFMESVANIRSFLSAAREVALNKPILAVKVGTSDAAARIIAAHTDIPAGSDEILDAAFRRVGVLRVNTVGELFSMADVLSKQPRPQGPRLVIISSAAGLSALAADSVSEVGGQLPPLSHESCDRLERLLEARWRTENPIQVPAGASPEICMQAGEIALHDPNCDGLLILTVLGGMSNSTGSADLLLRLDNPGHKPVLTCLPPEAGGELVSQVLIRTCIPTFANPHLAARAYAYMWQYEYSLRALYETPRLRSHSETEDLMREVAGRTIAAARAHGCTELNEFECKQLFAAYGINILDTRSAECEEDAVLVAKALGFPVVLEIIGSEMPGDRMSFTLPDAESIRAAWRFVAAQLEDRHNPTQIRATLHPYVAAKHCELRVASRVDPQFGPVLLFGPGGRLAEKLPDRALALPPLNATLAERMVEQTSIYAAVKADGGFDLPALLNLLVSFGQLVIEQPSIKEASINPVLLSSQACVGLNVAVSLHGTDVGVEQLPQPAIRPYPVQYASPWRTKRGDSLILRPIQPEDEPLMIKFHEGLSDYSVYLRYFQRIDLARRTAHDRLTRICFIDYDREMALVAVRRDPQTEERRIVGLGNLGRVRGRNEGEVAVIVSDNFQGHGLGTELMRRLLQVARAEKIKRVLASTMLENKPTIAMLKRVGFQVTVNFEDHVVDAEIDL